MQLKFNFVLRNTI